MACLAEFSAQSCFALRQPLSLGNLCITRGGVRVLLYRIPFAEPLAADSHPLAPVPVQVLAMDGNPADGFEAAAAATAAWQREQELARSFGGMLAELLGLQRGDEGEGRAMGGDGDDDGAGSSGAAAGEAVAGEAAVDGERLQAAALPPPGRGVGQSGAQDAVFTRAMCAGGIRVIHHQRFHIVLACDVHAGFLWER